MAINPEEITNIIKDRISNFETKLQIDEVGTVLTVGNGIARVFGLKNVMAGELVEFESGTKEIVLNLESNNIGVAILADDNSIKEGSTVKRTESIVEVPVNDALLGRVVNAISKPIDEKGEIKSDKKGRIEVKAPEIIPRKSIHKPLQTGIKAIDSMIPISRGQRELIIGDRKTGKTAIAINTIINQKGKDVVCIYVAVGQKQSTIHQIHQRLLEAGAMDYTTIVSASASNSAPLQFLAPYTKTTFDEYYKDNDKHTLIIFNDLTKQAQAYRQMSLLLRRPPSREAFPKNVFYLHSRLLKRAAKISDDKGAGSLTALPVIKTQKNNISAYIPTNIISITDGQIYLESDLFNSDIRPTVNISLSVSRISGSAQIKTMKKVANTLKLDLTQFRELAAFTAFRSDLDEATQRQLAKNKRLIELLKQGQYAPIKITNQVISIFAATKGLLNTIPVDKIQEVEKELVDTLRARNSDLVSSIEADKAINDDNAKKLTNAVKSFVSNLKF